MKKYPRYKDSGVAWLGEVPEHWEMKRLKNCFSLVTQKNTDETSKKLGLENIESWTGAYIETDSEFSGNGTAFQIDDLLFGKLRPYLAKVLLADFNGNAVGDIFVYRNKEEISPGFSFYRFLSKEFIDVVDGSTFGAKMPRASSEFIGNLPFAYPPIPEQTAIADYLDRKTAQIDAVIAKKERLLSLLQEFRESMTQKAMQSFKAEQIRLGVVADRITLPVLREDDKLYTSIGLYNRGRGIFHKKPAAGNKLGASDFYWVHDGTLVISGQFAWEGAVALAQPSENGCVASHRYHILRGKKGILETAYLLSFFKTQYGDMVLNDHSRGAAGRNRPLNIHTLMKEKIPVPPLPTQKYIVALIHKETLLKQETEKCVSLLKEYRTALISAVVTGKMDVREEPDHA